MAKYDEDYDWLADAFDDKKTAKEIEHAKSSKVPGCALALALFLFVVSLIIGAVAIGILGANLS